jgi:hypothetical protein
MQKRSSTSGTHHRAPSTSSTDQAPNTRGVSSAAATCLGDVLNAVHRALGKAGLDSGYSMRIAVRCLARWPAMRGSAARTWFDKGGGWTSADLPPKFRS